jgi:hypothetical protein
VQIDYSLTYGRILSILVFPDFLNRTSETDTSQRRVGNVPPEKIKEVADLLVEVEDFLLKGRYRPAGYFAALNFMDEIIQLADKITEQLAEETS